MPRWWSDLFWAAAICVALALVTVVAKSMLGVERRKSGRWRSLLAVTLLMAAGCADRPHAPALSPHGPVSPCGAGWGDCSGPAAAKA